MNPLTYALRHPLNRGKRLAAAGRVVRWQIACRLMVGPISVPFVEKTSLFVSRGMTGATGNWYCGLHEHEEMAFLLHFLEPNDLFMDVGANIGSYTVLAAGVIGAHVISIEPIPSTHGSLERNIILNGLSDRVSALCVGLSDTNSKLAFTADMDTVNHVVFGEENRATVRVSCVTMDQVLVDSKVPKLVKIDVEGHEKAILSGGTNTFSDLALEAVIMEVNGSGVRYGVRDDEILSAMHDFGFAACRYDPFSRELLDWAPVRSNAIFVRNRQDATKKVKSARSFSLVNGFI